MKINSEVNPEQSVEVSRTKRFRPGQALNPSEDAFVRDIVQPLVQNYISPCEDYCVRFFSFFNLIFLTTTVQLFQWLGTWNLLAYYVWPWSNTLIRDLVYFLIGIYLIFMSTKFFNLDKSYNIMCEKWQHGIPKKFGWNRKLQSYLRKSLSFVGYLFAWVGAWDYIDTRLISETGLRDTFYVVIPIFICFIFEELLSQESLYYLAAHSCGVCKECGCKDCCLPFDPLTMSKSQQNFIQLSVRGLISPCQDWMIILFNYVNVILIVTVIQLFLWVGMWDLFSYYIWPFDDTTYSYCIVGFLTMFISLVFFSPDQGYFEMEEIWQTGIPTSFGFRRKCRSYSRGMLNFLGFLCVWVGAWDALDNKIWPGSVIRDILYFVIPFFISFVLEEVLSAESVYYLAVKWKDEDDLNLKEKTCCT